MATGTAYGMGPSWGDRGNKELELVGDRRRGTASVEPFLVDSKAAPDEPGFAAT